MKPFLPLSLVIPTVALVSGCQTQHADHSTPPAGSARPVHWGYEGEAGPRHWGHLSPVYTACDHGNGQSPINITRAGTGTSHPVQLKYGATSLRIAHHEHVIDIVDNGHTIQVTVDEGSTLTTGKDTYQLKQFHFHTPSEHTIDGRHFPMEVHFVHQSASGQFAVVSALYVEGRENRNLAKLISHFPKAKGDSLHLPDEKLELTFHLPANSEAYSYTGSFTTPPCTENVEWLVLREPVAASREQLQAFAKRLNHNNRPVQPTHDRKVGTASIAGASAQ